MDDSIDMFGEATVFSWLDCNTGLCLYRLPPCWGGHVGTDCVPAPFMGACVCLELYPLVQSDTIMLQLGAQLLGWVACLPPAQCRTFFQARADVHQQCVHVVWCPHANNEASGS